MQIQGPAHLHGTNPIQGARPADSAAEQRSLDAVQDADQLDISPEADMISRLRDVPDIRADRVAEIRHQIEAGTYETSEKLDIAVGRLLDELG